MQVILDNEDESEGCCGKFWNVPRVPLIKRVLLAHWKD